jgi:hypothetical protein
MESEPKSIEAKKQQLVTDLKHLRDKYNEDIPKHILHSTTGSTPPKYKVRKAWFTGLVGMLDDLFRYSMISFTGELAQKIQHYKNDIINIEFSARPTTREDINKANSLINEIIAQLEK